MMKNLASALFLTERDAEFDDNAPKVKGRIVTTIHKAKEVRPLIERCITIARKSLAAQEAASQFATTAERGTEAWKQWRTSDEYRHWNDAIAPAVTARRRALRLLGDKQAVSVLFSEVAPRMANRDGGYTRILRLAKPRLGDAGAQAVLEFVGRHDRVKVKSEKPAFTDEDETVTTEDIKDEETAETASEMGQADIAEDNDAADNADES